MTRRVIVLFLTLFVAALGLAAPATATLDATRYEGEIDGARYVVVMPRNWNGALVLWSHGVYPVDFPEPTGTALTSQPATEPLLLKQGYALAASRYRTVRGWSIEQAVQDQHRLLDWFDRQFGKPRLTISAGESAGAITATLVAERAPRRFAGLMTFCGTVAGSAAYWNSALDLGFAVRTLLAPDSGIQLVKLSDPVVNQSKMDEILAKAGTDPTGRARLALASALADIPGWFDALNPRPTGVEEQISWQEVWARYFRIGAFGPNRTDVERWAGGNPSWNVGVDYAQLLARSSERALVEQAYAAAGLDLRADLDQLASAPRIAPDPAAAGYLARHGLPSGLTPWPVLTMHTQGDGVAPVSNQRAYADRVARLGDPGKLRQLFTARGGHCSFTSAEEITAFRTLTDRISTGRWNNIDPAVLNPAAAALGPDHQLIRDPLTGTYQPVPPAFLSYQPSPSPRPLPF